MVIPMTAEPATRSAARPLDLLEPACVAWALVRVLVAAAGLSVLWLALAGAGAAAAWAVGAFAAGALLLALVLHVAPARRSARVLQVGLVGGAVLVTVAAAVAGPAESPFVLFYVWLAPCAFLVWPPRVAAVFVALLSLATAVLIGWHPGHTTVDVEDVPAWLIAIGGPLTIGWVVSRLGARVVERQHDATRATRWQGLVGGIAGRAISETHVTGTVARAAAQVLKDALDADWVAITVPDGDRTERVAAGVAPRQLAADLQRVSADGPERPRATMTIVRAAGPLDAEEAALARRIAEVLDVAARRAEHEHEARARIGRDPVTGLPGRELFMRALQDALARPGQGGVLLLLDLNDFGLVNDTLGPAAGDRLLREVAQRFRRVLDDHVEVARIGGDKFAVYDGRAAGGVPAVDLARQLQRSLREPFDLGGAEQHASASIGLLVLAPGAYGQAQEALRDGHVAQRRATALGRGRYEIFDEGMRQGLEQRRVLEHDLRQALERREFRLVYQPIVELGSERVIGAETLLRWEHPEQGLIGPATFIGVAESSDLIVPIGAWVLREALRQLKAWEETVPSLGDFRLGINLSGRQLADPSFVATVQRLLRTYGLQPSRIVFELTETALVDEGPQVEEAVRELKGLGVGLALDDFGTGYASLRYVRRFPFDSLKLDRSFVVGRTDEDVALVRAAIAMGGALGLTVLAEGIETPEHAAELEAMGCRLGQGFHFARPVAAAGLRTLLWQRSQSPA